MFNKEICETERDKQYSKLETKTAFVGALLDYDHFHCLSLFCIAVTVYKGNLTEVQMIETLNII